MHARVKELIYRLNEIVSIHKLSSDAFCVIYGSYPDGVAKTTSDLDIFVANKEYNQALFHDLRKVVIEVHRKFNIPLDEEVSFRNKLLVTFNELEKAAQLNGMDMADNRFIVPDLIKTELYLESEQIKLRLLFNAISTPHYVLWENDYYSLVKSKVIENLFWLAIDLLGTKKSTLDEIVAILFEDKNYRQGERYLGYKPYPKVIQKIKENILNEAIRLNDGGVIVYDYGTKDVRVLNTGSLEGLKNRFVGSSKQPISSTIL